MSSRRRRPRHEPPPIEFFLDRSVGRHVVAEAVRATGHIAHVMADVYPDGEDQTIGDDEWIARCGQEGWVAITKDTAIVRHHRDALVEHSVRVFAIPSRNITGAEMARRVEFHIGRLVARASKPGPFFDILHPKRIERRFPKP